MEKSVYNSPMVPENSEVLFDSEYSSDDLQTHDGQLPRNAGKGEELVLTRPPTKSSNSTMTPNAGILNAPRKR